MKKTKKNLKKKIAITTGILLAVLLTAGLGISYYFGKMVAEGLFYQNEGNDTKYNSIAQLDIWGYDLDLFNSQFTGEAFTLEASDGNTIPVTYFSNDGNKDKDTVILVHGAGGDRVSIYPVAEIYLNNGWNVITFDMRGHGDNGSDMVTFGYFERIDVERLVDYAKENTNNKMVVVHGQSMGGGVTGMYAITEHAKENVDAVIMDSPVHSMEDMFLGVWHQMEDADGIPDRYMIACGSLYMKINYGFTFSDVEITEKQQYNTIKSLVIVSNQDTVCFPEYVTAFYENIAAENKSIAAIDTAHIMGAIDHPDVYEKTIFDFLAE